jgi:hypothetical protein
MLTHVDHLNHTFDFRCEHCYEHSIQLPIHPDAGHTTVRTEDVFITCPACKARWASQTPCPQCLHQPTKIHPPAIELMLFDYLTAIDTGDAEEPESLVGTILEGNNIVVLDDRTGRRHPQRQHLCRLILSLQAHPHIVAARAAAREVTP